MELKRIFDKNNNLVCIIIRNDYNADKTEFYTPDTFSQQLGSIVYPKGAKIQAHYHNPVKREVFLTQEVLFIKKGQVKAYLYDKEKVFIEEVVLNQNDIILLSSGGHGFEMIEDSIMVEVKQGPYAGEQDKTRFETSELEI